MPDLTAAASVDAPAATPRPATTRPATLGQRWLRFAKHFFLMLVVMYVGMLTLYPSGGLE